MRSRLAMHICTSKVVNGREKKSRMGHFGLFRFSELAASGLGKLIERAPPLNPPPATNHPPGGASQAAHIRSQLLDYA
jgi:hypothetical protein